MWTHVEAKPCNLCSDASEPNWGIVSSEKPRIVVVLECSDWRAERNGYAEELFSSATGKTLERILGDRLEKTAIVNAAKCLFAGGKRKPRETEFRSCASHLRQQIEEEFPDAELVLALGQRAAEALFPDRNFAELIGQQIGRVFIDPHPRRMTIEDKEEIKRLIVSI